MSRPRRSGILLPLFALPSRYGRISTPHAQFGFRHIYLSAATDYNSSE